MVVGGRGIEAKGIYRTGERDGAMHVGDGGRRRQGQGLVGEERGQAVARVASVTGKEPTGGVLGAGHVGGGHV